MRKGLQDLGKMTYERSGWARWLLLYRIGVAWIFLKVRFFIKIISWNRLFFNTWYLSFTFFNKPILWITESSDPSSITSKIKFLFLHFLCCEPDPLYSFQPFQFCCVQCSRNVYHQQETINFTSIKGTFYHFWGVFLVNKLQWCFWL